MRMYVLENAVKRAVACQDLQLLRRRSLSLLFSPSSSSFPFLGFAMIHGICLLLALVEVDETEVNFPIIYSHLKKAVFRDNAYVASRPECRV